MPQLWLHHCPSKAVVASFHVLKPAQALSVVKMKKSCLAPLEEGDASSAADLALLLVPCCSASRADQSVACLEEALVALAALQASEHAVDEETEPPKASQTSVSETMREANEIALCCEHDGNGPSV